MQKVLENQLSQEVLSPIKNVVIIGTGAIGSMFATELTLKNDQLNVVLVSHGDIHPEMLVKAETIILATPNHSVRQMVSEMLEKSSSAAELPTLVLIQNGVGVVEQAHMAVAESIDPSRQLSIVRASVFTQVTKREDRLEYDKKKLRVALSPVQCEEAEFQRVAVLFSSADFQINKFDNYQSMEWTKLLFNTLGTTSVITGLSPTETFSDPRLYKQELEAFAQRCEILRNAEIKIEQIPWVKTILLPALERAKYVSPFVLVRKIFAGMVSRQRSNQPSAAWHKVQTGGDLTEAIHYHQSFVDLALTNGMKPSKLDVHIVKLLKQQQAGHIQIAKMTDVERKRLVLGYIQND